MYLVLCCQGALWHRRQAVCVTSTLRLIKRGRCVMANHQSGRFSIQEAFHPLQCSFILLDATSVAQAARSALSPAKCGDIDLLLSTRTDQRAFLPLFLCLFWFCAHFSRHRLNLHFGVISAHWREERTLPSQKRVWLARFFTTPLI